MDEAELGRMGSLITVLYRLFWFLFDGGGRQTFSTCLGSSKFGVALLLLRAPVKNRNFKTYQSNFKIEIFLTQSS
jgi:hypothetical protein